MPRTKRSKGHKRTMGKRTVTLQIQFSVQGDRNVTDSAWAGLQEQIDEFVENVHNNTIFTTPANQSVVYNREVEVRPDMSFE